MGFLENMEGFTLSREGTWGKESFILLLLLTVLLFFRSDTASMELRALIKRACTGSKGSKGPRHLFVTLCG